ncbi:hypothetical protein ABW19_dt0207377 [Dactylella cylindrospora]|nr:hypothetical protein ABW19_dt0207377 [Dactylella cylindrospora]
MVRCCIMLLFCGSNDALGLRAGDTTGPPTGSRRSRREVARSGSLINRKSRAACHFSSLCCIEMNFFFSWVHVNFRNFRFHVSSCIFCPISWASVITGVNREMTVSKSSLSSFDRLPLLL